LARRSVVLRDIEGLGPAGGGGTCGMTVQKFPALRAPDQRAIKSGAYSPK
jgi:hypothetical protein